MREPGGVGPAAFVMYSLAVTAAIVYLIWYVAPAHGNSSIFVYIGICSLIGSLSVMSVKVPAGPRRARPWSAPGAHVSGGSSPAVTVNGNVCSARLMLHPAALIQRLH